MNTKQIISIAKIVLSGGLIVLLTTLLFSKDNFIIDNPLSLMELITGDKLYQSDVLVSNDTITPEFPVHDCDLVCPDFQLDKISVSATCGESDGSITVTPVGLPEGTVFIYTWSDGISSTTNEATGLSAGVYFVTVDVATSGNGSFRACAITDTVVVDNVDGPMFSVDTKPASCLTQDGKAFVDITSGTPPFTVSWGSGSSVVANALGVTTITGLAAGSYIFSVSDANGCLTTSEANVVLANEGVFQVILTKTDPSECGVADGQLTVTIDGGFAPYVITINDNDDNADSPNNQVTITGNTYTFTGLPSGLYLIEVTDSYLCSGKEIISLEVECDPDGWTAVNALCSEGIGYLVFDGSGSPNEYFEIRQLESVFVIETINGGSPAVVEVPLGAYKIKRLSNLDECVCEFPINVLAPGPLEVKIEPVDEECGANNEPDGQGSISIADISGGTSPYTVTITAEDGTVNDISGSLQLTGLSAGTYQVKIVDANNCLPAIKDIIIEGPDAIESGIEEDIIVCNGLPYQVTGGDTTLTYNWAPSTGLSSTTEANPIITVTQDITYYVTVTDTDQTDCNTVIDTINVTVEPDINLQIINDTLPCDGSNTIIEVITNPAVQIDSIAWFLNGQLVNTGSTYELTTNEAGNTYEVKVWSVNGCIDEVAFTLIQLPDEVVELNVSPADTLICEGEPVTFNANLTPVGSNASILWYDEAGNQVATGDDFTTIPPLGENKYLIIAGGGCATPDSAMVTVKVVESGAIEIMPSDTSICIGTDLTLSIDSEVGDCFVWLDSNGIPLDTASSIMVSPGLGIHTYVAYLPGLEDCAFPDTIQVEVLDLPPPIVIDTTLKVCIGDQIEYDLGNYPDSYQWKDEDGNVIATDAPLSIPATEAGTQLYIAMSMNDCGMVSDTLVVEVLEDGKLEIVPGDLQLCEPVDTVCLTVDFAAPECLVWTDIQGNEIGTGSELCIVPPVGVSQYIVSAPGLACIESDTATITVDALPPPIVIDTTLKVCIGDQIEYDLGNYPDSYQWKDEDGNVISTDAPLSIPATEAGTQLYIAMAMNDCGMVSDTLVVEVFEDGKLEIVPGDLQLCEPVDTVCLTVDFAAPECLVWTDIQGNEIGTGAELCIVPPVGVSQYIVSAPGLACIESDTATITVDALPPPIVIDTTLKVCIGDQIEYDLGNYPDSYQWKDEDGNVISTDAPLSIPATEAGTQLYIAMSMNDCGMVSDTLVVEVFEDGKLEIVPGDLQLCEPVDTVCLTVDFAAPECLVWTDIQGNEIGTGSELCIVPPVGVSQYIVSAPGLACIESDTATITVDALPPPIVIDTTLKVCIGDQIEYDLGNYPDSYQWKDEDGNVISTDAPLSIPATEAGTQLYIAMAMNDCGMVSDTLVVEIIEDGKLEIVPGDLQLCEPVDTVCLTVDFAAPECLVWTDLQGNEIGTGSELCIVPPVGVSQYIVSAPGLACIESDTATITVDTLPPPIVIDTTLKVCIGDQIEYDLGNYPDSYQWKDEDGNVISTDAPLSIPATEAGTQLYIAMAMNDCGMVSDTLVVEVFEDGKLEIAPGDLQLCEPVDTVCLTVDFAAPECLVWTDIQGNEIGTGSELCIVPPVGVSQYIVSAPGLACIESDTATITVDTLPTPIVIDTTLKVCIGDQIEYDLGNYPDSYQWKDEDGNVIATDAPLSIPATEAGTQLYIAMSMNDCGMVSDTLVVEVLEDGKLEIVPGDLQLCEPVDTVCLTVDFAAPECLVWTDLQGNEIGTGSELCIVPPVGVSQYIVSAPGLACIESDTATITVDTLPTPIVIDTTLKVCIGDQIAYDLGNYPDSYQWKDEDGNVIATDAPLSIPATEAGTQLYIAMSMNDCGMVSDTLVVEVIEDGKLEIVPGDLQLCEPVDTVCLTVDFAAPECLVWTDLQGNEIGTGSELCIVPPVGVSQYIVSAPGLACIESDTATITVDTLPSPIVIDTTLKVCIGDQIEYDLGNYPDSYQWKDEDGNVISTDAPLSIPATEAGTQLYIAMAMNDCGMVSDTLVVEVFEDGKLEIVPGDLQLCEPVDTVCLTVDFAAPECLVWTDIQGNEIGTGAELCIVPPVGVSQYIVSAPGLACIESDTATITVDTLPPPIVIDTTLKVCIGDQIEYDLGNYPDSYQWKDEDGNVISTDAPLSIPATEAGTQLYIAMAMNDCGMVSDTLVVEVLEDGKLEIVPGDLQLCEPVDTVCLTVDFAAPECLVWTDIQGNEIGTGAELCIVPPVGVSQYIVSAPGLACIESDTATITVDTLPTPIVIDTTLKVCIGDQIEYDLGNYPDSYQWKDEDGNVIATDAPLSIPATEAGTQLYIAMAMNDCGMVSDTLVVEVIEDGKLEIVPGDLQLCEPVDTVCLTVDFAAPECLVWTDLQGNEIGTGSELCIVPPVGVSQYIVSAPGLACIESDTATITVDTLPSPIVIDTTLKVCIGDQIEYDLGNYPDSYQWKDEDGNVISTDAPLSIPATEAGTQLYIAMAMNDCGMVSDTLVVEVIEDGKLEIVPGDLQLCEPVDTVCLTVDFAAPECLVWTDIQGNEIGTGSELCIVPPVGVSQYIVSAPGLACIESDTATITVDTLPTPIVIDTTLKVCIGDQIEYDLGNYPDSYQWKDEDGNVISTDAPLSIPATEAGTQLYIAMAMNDCGMVSDTLVVEVIEDGKLEIAPGDLQLCEPVDTVCLTVDFAAPECLVWTDIQGNEIGTGSELCIVPPVGVSQYIVSAPGLACIESDTATITVDTLPTPIVIDTTLKVCIGDQIEYDLGNYPDSYQWKDEDGNVIATDAPLSIPATEAGTQLYIAMSMNDCGMVSDTLVVEVFEDGKLEIVPGDLQLCEPVDTVCLTVDFAAPECLVWTDIQGNEIGTGAELCIVPPVGVSQYIVSAPGLACIESDTATITVDTLPTPIVIDTTLKVCIGDQIEYGLGNYPDSYQWKDEDGNVISTDAPLSIPATEAGTQLYIAMAMNDCGMVSDTLVVEVIEDGKLEIVPGDLQLCEPVDTVCLTVDFAASECLVWTDLQGNEIGTGAELCIVPPVGVSQYIVSAPGLACIESDTATITVDTLPPPIVIDTTLKVCIGDQIEYGLGNYPDSYQWKDEDGNVISTDAPLSIPATEAGTQLYIAMSMNDCGMVSDTLVVEVIEDGKLEIAPGDLQLCEPVDTVCLTVDFAAPECLVWTDIQGNEIGTGSELCIVPPVGVSQYIVSAPGLACIESDTATITVDTLPTPIVIDTTLKVCIGDQIEYDLGNYPDSYQWKDEDGNVISTDAPLSIPATEAGTQLYIAMSMNDCGMVSDTLVVEVIEDGKLEIAPGDLQLCEPVDTVCLTVDFAAPECLVWTDIQGNEIGTGSELCIVPPVGVSQYIVSAPGLACIESDTATITVDTLPTPIVIDTTLKVCIGDQIEYDLGNYPDSYQWKDEDGNVIATDAPLSIPATEAGTQLYIAMSMNDCGMVSDTLVVEVIEDGKLEIVPGDLQLCEPVDTVCLTVDFAAPECLVWTDIQGNEIGTGAELCIVPPVGVSQYIVSAPGLACIESDTATITVDTLPTPIVIDTTLKVCIGDQIEYDLGNYPDSYQWKDEDGNVIATDAPLSIPATEAGTQLYIAMSMNDCGMVSDTLVVEVIEDGKLEIVPGDLQLCEPVDTVCLTVDFAAPECLVWTDIQGNEIGTGAELCIVPPVGVSQYIVSAPGLACIESDTATITVDTLPPPIVIDTTLKVCIGDQIEYDLGNYPASYQWKDEDGNVISTDAPLSIPATEAGTQLYIAMSMNDCGMAADTLVVEVFEDGQLEIMPGDLQLCEPVDTVCLTVDFATPECLVWTDIQGNEIGTGAELCIVPPVGVSQYIVSVPGLACIESDTATITVDTLPPPIVIDTTLKVCIGDQIEYDLGNYPASYQWKDEDGNVISTDAPLSIPATEAGTQLYIAMAMNNCGMVSDTLVVEVFEDGQLEIMPGDLQLCEPVDTVCLTVDFAAPECLVWTDIQGNEIGTGAELCIVPPVGVSQYIVSVPGLACIESDTATITVDTIPPPIVIDTTLKVCIGDQIEYDLGNYPASYQWKDEDGNIIVTDAPLSIPATEAGTQLYIAMAMNDCGMAADTLVVEVFEDGQLEIMPGDLQLCEPVDTVCLTVDFAAPECLVWTDLQGNEIGTGAELCIVPPVGVSQYIVSVPGLACIESDTVTITVDTLLPPVLIDTTLKVCIGDTIKYDIGSYPNGYEWQDGQGSVIVTDTTLCVVASEPGLQGYIFFSENACGAVTDTLFVQVFDQGQLEIIPDTIIQLCAPVDTVCLNVDFEAPECLVWTDIQGNEIGTGSELCVVPPVGTSQYIVSVPGLACIESDTATIIVDTIPPPPPIDGGGVINVCIGDTAKYIINDYPYSFEWLDEDGNVLDFGDTLCYVPLDTGTTIFTVFSANGCGEVTDTLVVNAYDSTKLEIIPDTTLFLCEPIDTVICLEITDTTLAEFVLWQDISGDTLGIGSPLCVMPEAGINTYVASIPGADCLEADTTSIIIIPDSLGAEITVENDFTCEGDTVTLIASVDPPWTGHITEWYEDGLLVAVGVDTLNLVPDAGTYEYTAVVSNLCQTDTAVATVTIESLDLIIGASLDTICEGESTNLLVTGCPTCIFEWMPAGSLSDPTIADPVATPVETTTYTVIVSEGNCVDTLEITITVIPEEQCNCPEEYFVPTGFTPDGDGTNDFACLRSEFLSSYDKITFMVFNRWGEEMLMAVWEKSGPGDMPDPDMFCWDGYHNGKLLPPDVYGYYLELTCPDGNVIDEKGNITLLR